MNVHEISKRTGISLTNLRKLEKLNVLKCDAESELGASLRFHLARNQQMTAGQFLALLAAPDTINELGKYAPRAREQLFLLGDIAATSAPKHVTAEIREAGKGNDDSALVIAEWLKSILPTDPVPHVWVAVRMLAPLNEFLREQNAPMLSLALLNVRRLPEFAGHWRSEKIGTRNQMRYFAKKGLDL